jgi:putative colanic acid biosynthesis acetyltransferase WcaF
MNSVDLSSFNNVDYKPGKNRLIRSLWYVSNTLFFLNPLCPSSKIKILILKCFGAKIGKGVVIKPSVNIKYPWRLAIGDYVWIGENVWIDNLANVSIENHVCISQGALLLCGNHNYKKRSFDLIIGDIKIESGVWIGAKSIVTGGVTCRSHSILSVNSVASKDMNAYSIYRGNPAIETGKRTIE